jgi:hypothetical protein
MKPRDFGFTKYIIDPIAIIWSKLGVVEGNLESNIVNSEIPISYYMWQLLSIWKECR